MKKKQVVGLNESQLTKMVKEAVRKMLRETSYDEEYNFAEEEFDMIKDYYSDSKDGLINRLWYFIGDRKPDFIKHMKTSA